MSEDEVGAELDRLIRVALTTGGQVAERVARARADAERASQAGLLNAQREADQDLAKLVEAGRAVYGQVRDSGLWGQPNAQHRVGEALVAAEALKDVDPMAGPAAQYIRTEARRRHGTDSDQWLAAAVQSYLDDQSEALDRDVGVIAGDETRSTTSSTAADADAATNPTRSADSEYEVARQAFPLNAADDLNHRRPGRAPKARKQSSRTSARQRDRSR